MRRIIKPFTVEMRNSGRKPAGPMWPQNTEQPRVEWPDALMPAIAAGPEVDPDPPAPAGRVLPVLGESPVETMPTRRRGPRNVTEDTPQQEQADDSTARVEAGPTPASEPGSTVENPEPVLPVAIEADAVAPVVRRGKSRLSRDQFRRSERWKARLPAAVHRAGKKRAKAHDA